MQISSSKRVIWREGTLLRPQHFQQQQRQLEHDISLRVSMTRPFAWGIASLEFDEEKLHRGELSLSSVLAILPDGLLLDLSDLSDQNPSRALQEHFPSDAQELLVYLTVPNSPPGASFYGGPNEAQVTRFLKQHCEIADRSCEGRTAKIEVAYPRVHLRLGNEALDTPNALLIAKLRRQRGQYQLDPHFLPPSLTIQSSTGLVLRLRALLCSAHERYQELLTQRRQAGENQLDFEARDLQLYLWLSAIGGAISTLELLKSNRGATPYQLYVELVRLLGQLRPLCPAQSHKPISPYLHQRAQESFDPVFDELHEILRLGIKKEFSCLELERRSDGMWLGHLEASKLLRAQTFVLSVYSAEDDEQNAHRLPGLAKLASFQQISSVIESAVPGASLSFLPKPPAQIPSRSGWSYYKIDAQSSFWKEVLREQSVAFYAGAPFDDPNLNVQIFGLHAPVGTKQTFPRITS